MKTLSVEWYVMVEPLRSTHYEKLAGPFNDQKAAQAWINLQTGSKCRYRVGRITTEIMEPQ